MSGRIPKLTFWLVSFVTIDQFSKYLAASCLSQDGLFFIKKNLGFKLYKNYGLAFGLPISNVLAISLNVLALLLFLFISKKKQISLFSFSLILSGALSNLIDRIFLGYTVDFLVFSSRWILNLADAFIICGLALAIFSIAKFKL